MGLFDKLFSTSDDTSPKDTTPWIDITDISQLNDIMEKSKSTPQLIFKHSTRCGISRMVIGQFKKEYRLTNTEADLYYLDLLSHRDISNEITSRFNVIHESPQLLIVKDGVVVKHESHGAINDLVLEDVI